MVSELKLSVIASSIGGKGVAKIDLESFEKLDLKEGGKVIVKYGTKSKEMTATCDPVFRACSARLMAEDIADLRVQPGNHVFVSKKGGKKEKKAPAPASTKKGKKKGKRGRKKSKGSTASLDSF